MIFALSEIIDEKYFILAASGMIMILHHENLGNHEFDYFKYLNLQVDSLVYDSAKGPVLLIL